MCFSAGASFAGGAVISAIGAATLSKVSHPSQRVFSLIPIFFGLQQVAEGFVWMSLPDPGIPWLLNISKYYFLAMALVVWPTMIPLSVLPMEKDRNRKKMLWVFLSAGIALSLYYGFCLVSFPANPQILGFHIQYNNMFPEKLAFPAFWVYLVVTVLPLFVSTVKRMKVFGALIFISCAITAIFFTQFLTSVWCFFAALISGVVYWIVREYRTETATETDRQTSGQAI